MATYDQIRDAVQEKNGRYEPDCWIAHVKEQNGLPVKAAHNRQSKDQRAKPCPDDVKPLIEATMRRFGMIRSVSSGSGRACWRDRARHPHRVGHLGQLQIKSRGLLG